MPPVLIVLKLIFGSFISKASISESLWLPLERPLLGIWPTTQACALTGDQTHSLGASRKCCDPLSYRTARAISVFFQKLGSDWLVVPHFWAVVLGAAWGD